jgi:tetratricopeptide (TPR) repeat protein
MEDPSEDEVARYRSWRRKLRRRFPFPALVAGIPAVMLVPLLAGDAGVLVWLWREHQSFASFTVYAWWFLLISATFRLVLGCFSVWSHHAYSASQKSTTSQNPVPVSFRITGLVVPGFMIVALLANRIDIAVVTFFISSAVSHFSKAFQVKQRRYAVHGLLSVLTAGTAVALPPIIATLLWAVNTALLLLRWPSLRELLDRKPTRRKFVQYAYEQQTAHSDLRPMRLFDSLCEAQMWDEALAELEREKNRKRRKTSLRWHRARAYLGAGRVDDVIALNQEVNPADSPLAVLLAVAYAKRGEQQLAVSVAQAATSRGDDRAALCMAEVHQEIGDLPRALWWYERAIEDSMKEALHGAGETLMDMNDPAEAKYPLWQAVCLSSWLNADDLMQLARCYRQLGKTRAAAEAEQIAQEQIALEQPALNRATSTRTAAPA